MDQLISFSFTLFPLFIYNHISFSTQSQSLTSCLSLPVVFCFAFIHLRTTWFTESQPWLILTVTPLRPTVSFLHHCYCLSLQFCSFCFCWVWSDHACWFSLMIMRMDLHEPDCLFVGFVWIFLGWNWFWVGFWSPNLLD